MVNYRTGIYNAETGVRYYLVWKNRDEYVAGRAFLDRLTGGAYLGHSEERDTYILETRRQFEELVAFRREFERTGGRPGH